MKRVSYLILSFLVGILLFDNVYAANASLSGNSSVTLGDSTTITSRISSNEPIFFIEGTLKCTGAGVDKSIDLSFDNMDNSVKSNSKSITIKPSSEGKVTCVINAKVIDASSSSWVSVSNSGTISVVKPREKSTNNNLKDLSVEGYTMSPSFSKDTLEYTIDIDKNVEKVKINTKTEDGYARVSGNGEQEVEEGSNKLEVVVTSETGSSKTYTLNINVKDNNPIVKTIGDKEYSVIKRAKSLALPDELDKELFKETTVKIDDVEIPAYNSEELNLTLVGLKDTKGNSYLFVFEDGNITKKYELFSSNKITILFSEPKNILDGYTKTDISIDGKEYTAYKNNDTILIYGTNTSTNLENWYKYDEKENTIQIYDNSLVEKLSNQEKDFNKTLDEYKLVIIGLAGLSFVLLVVIIILLVTKSNKKNNYKIEEKKIEIKKEEPKVEPKQEVKKEIVKEEVATKVEEKETKKKDKKVEVKDEIEKVEENLEKEQEKTKEIIADFDEIKEDLKDNTKPEKKDEVKQEEDDELMDPYDFLDIKRKRRK